ncbi:GNAT family N-acetyltransferase [Leuconostoc falkenbergense]|nr:GNAT family protein [Leuconostoc falkenbergense]
MENYASQNLLKKLGFSFETVRKGFMLENNKWTDKAVFYRNLN